ncbi:MAG: hypothetical protein KDA66_08500 [Planctomycetaceae bacterium]|nr:hypothetical protein [Planctomycetaceae bacterium]
MSSRKLFGGNGSLPEFDLLKLEDVSLEISTIQCSYQRWQLPRMHRAGGLVTFAGTYKHGSAGSDDARFIRWRINEFCDLGYPLLIDGLVIDCRALNYEWGDDLYFAPSNKPIDFPTLVVISDSQREAYSGILGNRDLRFDLNAALAEMTELFRQMKPLL